LISNSSSINFSINEDYSIIKEIVNPATGPYTIGQTMTYRITVDNTGAQAITNLPLYDVFDHNCLQYLGASISPNIIIEDTLRWVTLGTLASGSSLQILVYFKTLENCDPLENKTAQSMPFRRRWIPLVPLNMWM
jgi:uncharacterized repeat protein (TIGR01451 family)